VKILIVDDHALARDSLTRLCARSDDVQVVGEAACGKAAIDAADTLNPDIMLLDVELPDMSGFELLRAVGAGTRPLGIMVSSCPDHASRAFAEGAIDYFVMPVTEVRFDLAIARARHQFNDALPVRGRLTSNASERGPTLPSPPRFLVGERQRRLYPLDPKSIDYIEEYLSRDSIKHLSTELAELGFVRIARSFLVNAAAVLYAERAGHGIFALTLTSGVCLHSSAAYRDSLLRAIPLPTLSKRHGAIDS
jgi:two-component system, LytTR family, response regulator